MSQEMNFNWWTEILKLVGAFIIYLGLYIWLGLMFVCGMNWRDSEPGTRTEARLEIDLEEQGDMYDLVELGGDRGGSERR